MSEQQEKGRQTRGLPQTFLRAAMEARRRMWDRIKLRHISINNQKRIPAYGQGKAFLYVLIYAILPRTVHRSCQMEALAGPLQASCWHQEAKFIRACPSLDLRQDTPPVLI